ncbi:hypothetical protein L0152_23645 [bacterium]|nr:hypothetical protein [bacterium]
MGIDIKNLFRFSADLSGLNVQPKIKNWKPLLTAIKIKGIEVIIGLVTQ